MRSANEENREMKHVKKLTKDAPVTAAFWQWPAQIKTGTGKAAYRATLDNPAALGNLGKFGV